MHDSVAPDIRGLETDAYQQSGYFTSEQARENGVSRQLLTHHVKQGRFERVRRGLYRVRGFPSAQHDDIREKWMAVGRGEGDRLARERACTARAERQYSRTTSTFSFHADTGDSVAHQASSSTPTPTTRRSAPSGERACQSLRRREHSWTSPETSSLNRQRWPRGKHWPWVSLHAGNSRTKPNAGGKTRVLATLLPEQ